MTPSSDAHGERMRREWDAMARDDAVYYISATSGLDEEAFLESGEELIATTLERLAYSPSPEGTALDIGCGVGRAVRALSRRFDRAIGVDVSPEMVARATALHTDYANVEFRACSGVGLSCIETASIGFCFSYTVFQHIADREVVAAYLREIARVLTPTGVACLQFDTRQGGWWRWLVDRGKRAVGAVLDAVGLRRLYAREPRYPSRFVYPIPRATVARMLADAGLRVDRADQPNDQATFFLCSKGEA